MTTRQMILHASAVAVANRGCLIIGASGAGKSTLAIEMIASGAGLISDDQTIVYQTSTGLALKTPQTIAGRIEARGVGILRLPHLSAPLKLIVDLDRSPQRHPPRRFLHLLGRATPVILGKGSESLSAIVSVLLAHGLDAST